MLNLPRVPIVHTTRHLACISCRASLEIADEAVLRHHHHSNQPISNLTCPRCGADNRNWLHVEYPYESRTNNNEKGRQSYQFALWQKRFPKAAFALRCSMVLAVIAGLLTLLLQFSVWQGVAISLFVMLGSVAPIFELTGRWREGRDDKHLRTILKSQSGIRSWQAKAWWRGAILTTSLAFLFPLLAIWMIPLLFNAVGNPQNSDVAQLLTHLQVVRTDMNEIRSTAEQARFNIEKWPIQEETAVNDIRDYAIESMHNVTVGMQEEIKLAQQELSQAVATSKNRNNNFFTIWAIFVTGSGLFSVVMSICAVDEFITRVDRQLPRPLFTKLPRLLQVVQHDAVMAVGHEVGSVSWLNVVRNDTGGITLQGVYKEPQNGHQNGQSPLQARGQQIYYYIESNQWGRIIDIQIQHKKGRRYADLSTEHNRGRVYERTVLVR